MEDLELSPPPLSLSLWSSHYQCEWAFNQLFPFTAGDSTSCAQCHLTRTHARARTRTHTLSQNVKYNHQCVFMNISVLELFTPTLDLLNHQLNDAYLRLFKSAFSC